MIKNLILGAIAAALIVVGIVTVMDMNKAEAPVAEQAAPAKEAK